MYNLLRTVNGDTEVQCECKRCYRVEGRPKRAKCPWCGRVSSLIDGASKPEKITSVAVVGCKIDGWSGIPRPRLADGFFQDDGREA